MASGDWQYMAARMTGDGYFDILETELPITIDSIDRSLSAPSSMGGVITNEVERLKIGGRLLLEPWNTVIIAVASGYIRGMTIYRRPTFNGPTWALDQIGLSGYPLKQIYDGEKVYIDTDPLDIVREVWNHLQSQPGGNLGVTIDQLASPIRVGKPAEQVEFTTGAGENVSFEAGPRKLNWWQTTDCMKVVNDYSKETPFDWREDLSWNGDQPHCHIAMGYPTIGGRRTDLNGFILGQNLSTEPAAAGGEYANQLHVLGAGEGRDRVRGFARRTDGRIRRAEAIEDDSLESIRAANVAAETGLAVRRGELTVDNITVYDHPNAPLEAIELGNSYKLFAVTEHFEVDTYVRVVARSDAPGQSDHATLTVVREELR